MGDINEQFTPEELEILGEDVPRETEDKEPEDVDADQEQEPETPAEEPEGNVSEGEQETEQKEESEVKEKEDGDGILKDDDPDGFKKRVGKVLEKQREVEQKLDLLKRNPEEYYKKYPDEAPAKQAVTQEEPEKSQPAASSKAEEIKLLSMREASAMVVNGGEFNGMTLKEVAEVDSLAAMDLYMDYKASVENHNRDIAEKRQAEESAKRESAQRAQAEVDNFMTKLSSDMYGRDLKGLNQDEKQVVDGVFKQVFDFCMDTTNNVYNLDVAYVYLNKDKLINDAMQKGVKTLASQLERKSAISIGSESGDSVKSGYDAYMEMTPDQAATRLSNMTDKQMKDFINKAPAKLKSRFPNIDWEPF